jgi:hypothetical protein
MLTVKAEQISKGLPRCFDRKSFLKRGQLQNFTKLNNVLSVL